MIFIAVAIPALFIALALLVRHLQGEDEDFEPTEKKHLVDYDDFNGN